MLASLLTSVILLDCAAMQTPQPQKARTLEQLLATDKPAWPELQKWLAEARNHVEVIPPPNRERREAALVGVNVTTRSMLGAITYETGGILIDHGWVRHLGAESERLGRSIARWNNDCLGPSPDKPPRYVLVADDVIGGFFAQFPKEGGGVSMRYFAPDTLEWQDLGMGHGQFVHWLLNGDVAKFYEDWRWKGWEKDVAALPGRSAFLFSPLPSLEGPAFKDRRRGVAPLLELFDFQVERVPHPVLALSRPAAGKSVGFADLESMPVTLHGTPCRIGAYRVDSRLGVGLALPRSLTGVVTFMTGTGIRPERVAVDLESADKDGSEASASPPLSARVASDGDQRVVWFEVGDAKRHREGDYLRICLMLVRGDRSVARLPEAGMLAIEWRD